MKIKYITTAIDYPNSLPHIGHAYEKILADFYNRYYKQKSENTFYKLVLMNMELKYTIRQKIIK